MIRKLLSVGEVASILGVSASSVRILCDTKKLASVRPLGKNGHRKIRPEAVEAYLAQLENDQVQPSEIYEQQQAVLNAKSLADTLASIKKIRA